MKVTGTVDLWKDELALIAVASLQASWDVTIISVRNLLGSVLVYFTRKIILLPHFCPLFTEHKVCLSQKGVSGATTVSNKAASFDLLPPGARFMTKFGIVEVVNDCREFPTGRLPPDIKKKVKAYAPLKLRKEAKNAKTHDDIASQLRARRTRINTLYQTRSPNKISTFHAYFGDDPQRIMVSSSPPIPPPAMDELPEDPLAPPNFFPDRMVECILIPDDRLRYLSTDIRTPIEARDAGQTGKTPTRLFLQRRLLMEEYNPDLSTYSCAECGGVFLSLGGMRYHCNASVCVQNSIREAEKRAARQRTVENNRLRLLANPVDKGRKRMLKTKKTRKRDTAMYPQVLISLGFELVQDDLRFTRFGNINANLEAPLVDLDPADEDDQFECLDPTEIADSLRHEWRAAQREYLLAAADQKYGSMYKGVYQSLGFKKGRKRPRSPSRVRKRKVAKAPPPAKPVSMPPIIDTQALADEINSGRYPSMSRYEGDGHFDICALCKDGGDLICCDFCRNSEHLACIRGRFTIKAPEPEDDFLCHKCIQNVQVKRNRAEKRRLMKLDREEEQRRREDEEEELLSPGIQKGQEYPYMADQARDVNELLELLQDSQTRLKQGLATSKMNNIRRKTMECFHIEAV